MNHAQVWLADRLSLTAPGSVCRNNHGLLLPVRPRGLSLEMQKRENLSKASVASRRTAFAVIPAKLGCVEDCCDRWRMPQPRLPHADRAALLIRSIPAITIKL